MSTSLIPERPLLISPVLAQTIGLEEAVMLHVLSELMLQNPVLIRKQRKWIELTTTSTLAAMPFWEADDIKRIQKNLLEKGELNVSEVAYTVGFNDPLYFSRVFSQEFGHPPTDLYK